MGRPPLKLSREDIMDRILARSRYDWSTGCWLYEGPDNSHGYGRSNGMNGERIPTHRTAYQYFFGRPKNLVLHKTCCPNKNCWAPEHLYDGTYKDNALDYYRRR